MRNSIACTFQLLNTFLAFFLCQFAQLQGQTFQTAIGYPLPTDERGVSGVITNTGDYLVLGANIRHPAGFFNGSGDMQLDWLDATGTVLQPSKMIGQDVNETAVWIEKSVDCNGVSGYIIAGNVRQGSTGDMLLTQTDLNGNPLWTQYYGASGFDETSACVKQDGSGNIILVGTKTDTSTNVSAVYAVKTDCSGKFQWSRSYRINGSLKTASVTAFATQPQGCGGLASAYYITGKAISPNGIEEVFILSLNTVNGSPLWMKTYDVAPNANDAGTCIQGQCNSNPAGNGGLWVSGYSQDPNTADKQVLMLHTDLNGNLNWANNYDILNSKQEFATHFQFSAAGDLILTGKAEEYAVSDPPETGQCLLMRMANTGGPVQWARVYTLGYASQGNRVEPTASDECFIAGHTYEIIQPHAFDYNLLAIKTDAKGRLDGDCFHSPETKIIKQTPKITPVTPIVTPHQDFFATGLLAKVFDEKQRFCPTPSDPCQNIAINANFSVSASGSTITCTDLSTVGSGTIFSWNWDFGDSNTATFTSPTNPSHTYSSSGTYVVCVVVTAGTAGMVCRDTFCVDVVIKPETECTDNLVKNGTFTAGLTAGNLGSGGNVNNWTTIFNTPQVITTDSCADAGAIQMWGDQVVGEGIGQPVNFVSGVTYEVRFCGLWLPSVQDSVRIRFRASLSPLTNYFNCSSGTCDEIFLSPVLTTTWTTYTSALWTPTQNYNYLNITLWNNYAINDGAYVSWARIDDICVRRVGIATSTQEAAGISAKVYPNPTTGELHVEFAKPLESDALLLVTDLMGRRLQEVPLNAGQLRQSLELSGYANGVYLVQVLGADGLIQCTRKVMYQSGY